MTRCTSCNWAPHDLERHEQLCRAGRHPVLIVGTYTNGRCRDCQRASSRAYRDRNLERERERVRLAHRRRRELR